MNESEIQDDLFETVSAEFLAKVREGQSPSVEDYAAEYPDIADEIRELFPTMKAMERVKVVREHESGGQASLGARKIERIGDFRIIREVGRGGMGVVYEAEQESLERRVAVKVLPPHLLLDSSHVRRFHREAQTAARLHHTNIVPVFGVGQEADLHYYVMQLIDGRGLDRVLLTNSDPSVSVTLAVQDSRPSNLSQFIMDGSTDSNRHSLTNTDSNPPELTDQTSNGTVFTPREVARIGASIADALAYAHEQGVLHRDIKPANILIDDHDNVWLADFGLARVLEGDESRSDHVGGTLRYMAPERFEGVGDTRSDIYGTGITLYELATGTKAYRAANSGQLVHYITQSEPVAPRSVNRNIPRDLETIIQKAIAREPDRRYQTASALADDLHRFLDGRTILARRLNPLQKLGRWCRRNPALASSLSLVALLLVTVASLLSIGYVRKTKLNEQLELSLNNERSARETAEATSALALETLDNVFEGFYPTTPHTVILTSSDSFGADSETTEEFIVPAQPAISPQIADTLGELLPLFSRLAAQTGQDPHVRERAASAYQRIGLIYRQLGDFDAARDAITQAIPLLERLLEESPDDHAKRTLALAQLNNDLGDIERLSRNAEAGRAAYSSALVLLEGFDRLESPNMTIELARTHFSLGQRDGFVFSGRGGRGSRSGRPRGGPPRRRPEETENGRTVDPPRDQTVSSEPQRPRPNEDGRPPRDRGPRDEDRDRGERRGESDPFRDRLNQQREHLQTAITLLESLPDDVRDGRALLLLARAYRESASQRRRDQRNEAEQDRQKAITLLEELTAAAPGIPDYQFELAEALAAMDPRSYGAEDNTETIQRVKRAHRVTRDLVRTHPSIPAYANSYLDISNKLAWLQRREEDFDGAEETMKTSLNRIDDFSTRFEDQGMMVMWTSRFSRGLADLYIDQDRPAEAIPLLERSAELRASAATRLKESNSQMSFFMSHGAADSYRRLAELQEKTGNKDAAKVAREKAEEFGGDFRIPNPDGPRGPRSESPTTPPSA